MKGSLSLAEKLFAVPTPAGAYYAIGNNDPEPGRIMLLNMLSDSMDQPVERKSLLKWCMRDDIHFALKLLYRLQRLDFVRGSRHPSAAPPDGRLEDLLPPLLAQLSLTGNAVLADDKGFYISTAGYRHETAEELAAMAMDLYLVFQRNTQLLRGNLKEPSEALALVAPDGRSNLGFWPLHIGEQLFLLVIKGAPQLNTPAFIELVQLLAKRYSSASTPNVSD